MPSIRARRSEAHACTALAAWIAILASCVAAHAETEVDEIDRWVPAFSLSFDTLTQKASGSITSGPVLGPPLPSGCNDDGNGRLCPASDPKLRPDSSGSDTDVAPLVGGSVELMTPRLFEPLLSPRLFAHVDVAAAFGFERNLAGEGSPDEFEAPRVLPSHITVFENTVRGQGSRAKAQVRRIVVSAGGGVAFSFDVFGRRLRLKPSAEYLRQELDLIGALHRPVKLREPARKGSLADFRLIRLTASEKKTIHGVGPGLELDVDTLRAGPFLLTVFFQGRGYYLLGDLDDTLIATNEFGETARFDFDRERWAWRGGAGLRFRFLPE